MEALPPRHSCLEPWQVCWQEATGSHAPGWEWLPSLPVHPPRHSFSQIVQCIVSGKSQRAGQEPTYILVISLHPDHSPRVPRFPKTAPSSLSSSPRGIQRSQCFTKRPGTREHQNHVTFHTGRPSTPGPPLTQPNGRGPSWITKATQRWGCAIRMLAQLVLRGPRAGLR